MTTDKFKKDALAALLRFSLADFARKACSTVGNTEYREPWHLPVVCAHLAKVHDRRTKRLILNLPPRTFKSFLATSCFPAWHLGHFPHAKIMILSHDLKLAALHADLVSNIMGAPWYQEIFATRIRSDFDRQMHFQTTEGGGVFATSMEGGLTGHGADIIILDDPLDAGDASYPSIRNRVNALFDEKISSRLDDQANGAIVVVAQRLHVQDLPGHLLSRGDFEQLVLPLVALEDQTFDVDGSVWHRAAGHVLDPTHYTEEVIERLRLKSRVFLSQYQQSPTLEEGALIRREWFHTVEAAPASLARVLSIDLAQSASASSSYSCCLSFLTDGTTHYLEDAVRKKGDYPEIKAWVCELIRQHSPRIVIIENAAFGASLIPELESMGHNIVAAAKPSTPKAERVDRHLEKLCSGRVRLVAHGVGHQDFLAELVAFPTGDTDDQVDALTQFLTFMETAKLSPAPALARKAPKRHYGAGSHPMRDPRVLGRLRKLR